MSGPRLLLLKTWVPAKKRKLKSGKVVDVAGYYDPRSPKRGYMKCGAWTRSKEVERSAWQVPVSESKSIASRDIPREARKEALIFCLRNVKGVYRNFESDTNIVVNRKGIEKALSHGVSVEHFNACSAIPEMLKHGFFDRFSVATKEKHQTHDGLFNYLYAPVRFDDSVRIAKVVLREIDGKQYFYDFDLSKKVEGSDITAPRKNRVAADNVEPSGDDASLHSLARKKRTDSSRSSSVMSVSEILKYVNADGGVMKKSMLVLFCRDAA